MNFYTQKWPPGPFEEWTVFICIVLGPTQKLTAHSSTLSFPKDDSLVNPEVILHVESDLILTVFCIFFRKTDWN